MTEDRTARSSAEPAAAPRTGETLAGQPTSPGADVWIKVGEIVGPFGVRGELKVRPTTDFPDRFERTTTVYVGEQHTPYTVTGAHEHKRMVLLSLTTIADATAAERLRGKSVYIPEGELTELPPDQFYLHDVVGLRVEHVNGQYLGEVADIYATGGNDIFVVRNAQTGAEVLVPAVAAFIKAIDLTAGIVRIEPIPGLFDDQAEEAR